MKPGSLIEATIAERAASLTRHELKHILCDIR